MLCFFLVSLSFGLIVIVSRMYTMPLTNTNFFDNLYHEPHQIVTIFVSDWEYG